MSAPEPRFIPLSDLVRPTVDPPAESDPPVAGVAPVAVPSVTLADVDAALREARCFRAVVQAALETQTATLLRELAAAVLARELQLAPVDVGALVRRLVAERAADTPVRVRVAPEDAATVCDLPLAVDPDLLPGDAVLECANGEIDARLGVRLSDVLLELGA